MRVRNVGPRGAVKALVAAGAATAVAVVPATATAVPTQPANPGEELNVNAVNRHLAAFQRIAHQNDGNRASGTSGYQASVDYVVSKLRDAGFDVSTPEFRYTKYYLESIELSVGGEPVEASAMEYSPAGNVTAPLSVVPADDSTGCEATDYEGTDVAGTIALIKRGACTFAKKQRIASEQGADAAIIYNNVDGALNGTLGGADAGVIPTAGVTKAVGEQLVGQAGTEATLNLQARFDEVTTENVVAQTSTGNPENVVMAGAHLDSVAEGAGINDNGTGSAGLLETAIQLGGSPDINNAVRFAWWGAEESGLIGSTKYVQGLSSEQQSKIAMYLNFDMIGSPNAGYFAYDGDNSDGVGAGPGPKGSGAIEQAFVDALNSQGVEVEGTDFTGRSDYGPFIANGIPAGGLFTGAEGVKTQAQAEKWGGEAGKAYDPNYHTVGDDMDNVDRQALKRNTKAIAMVVTKYAQNAEEVTSVRANSVGAQSFTTSSQASQESQGHTCQLPLK
ncbi:Zn-dependent M28 family amino/carboxypeptidase [Halopolyspora algeriensis]|uniref:Zn-dependent M28 family amino/carboxypeptidase n=2 Tax=Halopolyspora algeriensis TaxID=1500506 RepID=A0A368VBN1_9ACTN|nr:M28 family metallopeptidase [Halopolyspora algeriensis]RCW38526.1 Zn-dependent M28 family amino/carboxypeptidase [Halopolyspora algeriensis]TQM42607.1 Zn-dependent M28 family amino/carboxypeptidase [Halopolyspora algeriensis]